MEVKKVDWDKEKYGLIWKCIDVFTQEELIYINELIRDYIPPPPKETSFQGSELTTIRDRISPIVCNLYALFRQEYRREGISVFAEEDIYRVAKYYKNNWNLKHGSNCNVEVHLQATAQGVNYRIHPDNEEKLLSLLVYISPEEQEPTYFHEGGFKKEHSYKEEDPDPVRTIPWKVNTGYAFLANSLSMHSYANTKFNTDRWVVMCNIRTTK